MLMYGFCTTDPDLNTYILDGIEGTTGVSPDEGSSNT